MMLEYDSANAPAPGQVENMDDAREWTNAEGLHFTEVSRQEYANCAFTAGFVEGHPVDTIFLRAERWQEPGENVDLFFLLRPDEALALIAILSRTLFEEADRGIQDGKNS